jgi:hypothetical protein
MFLVVNIKQREKMEGHCFLNCFLYVGKLNRGISVVDTVRILKGDTVTEDDIFKATVLGWMIEFVSTTNRSKYSARNTKIDFKFIAPSFLLGF